MTTSLFELLKKHPHVLKLAKSMMAGLGVINAVALGLRLHEGTTLQIVIAQFGIMAMAVISYYMMAKAQEVIAAAEEEKNDNHDYEVGA